MPKSDFQIQLDEKAECVNAGLGQVLAEQTQIYERLRRALMYILKGKGKRIRGALVLWSCEVVSGGINHDAQIAAAAIEMVHAYSLVHDDLPAMDNDDMRRGRATCHKAFDEATAILAGDGLLTLAFEILAKEIDDPVIASKLIGQLAESAGAAGMIAGQMADLEAENAQPDESLLEYIHTNKTAKMFQCAALMGGICGKADIGQLRSLAEYGLNIGLGFQIADDILDVNATSEQLGKTAGKDIQAGKMTYPELFGVSKSGQLAQELANKAIEALGQLGERAEILRKLALALLKRVK